MKRINVALAAFILISTAAFALNEDSSVYNVEIPLMLNIYWQGGIGSGDVNLTGANAITILEMSVGFKEAIPGGALKCDANTLFDVFVQASDPKFIPAGAGAKNISDLSVSVGGAAYISLDPTFPVRVIDGYSAGAGSVFPLEYKVDLSFSDTPDMYTAYLTYTMAPH